MVQTISSRLQMTELEPKLCMVAGMLDSTNKFSGSLYTHADMYGLF